jgi:hypothetical protein
MSNDKRDKLLDDLCKDMEDMIDTCGIGKYKKEILSAINHSYSIGRLSILVELSKDIVKDSNKNSN